VDPAEHKMATEHQPHTRPTLTDLQYDRSMTDIPLIVVVVLVSTVIGVGLLVCLVGNLPGLRSTRTAVILAAACGMGALVWACVLSVRNATGRDIRRKLQASAGTDLVDRLKQVAPRFRSIYPQRLAREATRALAEEGAFGATVRIAPGDQAPPIEPISVPFEPMRLEEMVSVDTPSPQTGATGESPDAGHEPAAQAQPRGFRRNLLLKGGWALVVLYGILWLVHAIDSLLKLRPTPRFIIWSFGLLAFVLLPVGSNWMTGREWLAVPGAIVVRQAGWLRRRWELRLFRPDNSVLLMYRLLQHQWVLVLADGDVCESTIGTRAELESALRAWLSPLPAPSLEQLSDLR
jgi:hypothetical protein